MKKIICLIFASLVFMACSSDKVLKINVESTTNYNRSKELVQISVSELQGKLNLTDGQTYIVKNAEEEIIPSQVTYDGFLIFQLGSKDAKADFTVSAGLPQEFESKTYGRLFSERYDDFTWENDFVAFRLYGPALVAIDGPSNGIDVWYKRTNDLIIDKWYKEELAKISSYHTDSGEGLDDYKVGRALGGGAMAPYVNGQLWLNENFILSEVLENGPLRTTVKFIYKDINVDGANFSEIRTISIDAGSQLTKIRQEYGTSTPIKVAAGISIRGNDSIVSSLENGYNIYLEDNRNTGEVYIVNLFPTIIESVEKNTYEFINPKSKQKEIHSHVLSVVTYEPNKPVIYYTGYGWTKFGFANLNEFENYVKNFSQSIKNPLKYTIQ
ncbi:MAG: DUF4861 family protein [Breznakibacter sp.]